MSPEDRAAIADMITQNSARPSFGGLSLKDVLPWVFVAVAGFYALDKRQATSGVATAVSVEGLSLQMVDIKADVAALQSKLERPRFTQEDFDRQMQPFFVRVESVFQNQNEETARLIRLENRLSQIETQRN